MTTTDFEIVLDEQLDFPVACEYSIHGEFGPKELPAEWIVKAGYSPCGHRPVRSLLLCEPCKDLRTGCAVISCIVCKQPYPNDILEVERL